MAGGAAASEKQRGDGKGVTLLYVFAQYQPWLSVLYFWTLALKEVGPALLGTGRGRVAKRLSSSSVSGLGSQDLDQHAQDPQSLCVDQLKYRNSAKGAFALCSGSHRGSRCYGYVFLCADLPRSPKNASVASRVGLESCVLITQPLHMTTSSQSQYIKHLVSFWRAAHIIVLPHIVGNWARRTI